MQIGIWEHHELEAAVAPGHSVLQHGRRRRIQHTVALFLTDLEQSLESWAGKAQLRI